MSDHNHYNHYRDDNFNVNQAKEYTLLLQVETGSFSYAVANENRLIACGQHCSLQEFEQPGELNDLLTAAYKKVITGIPATALSLIPESLFSQENIPGFARLLDVKDDEKVFAQTLDDKNAIIYKTAAGAVAVAEKFGLQNAVYTAKGWITAIAKSGPPDTDLYLDIGDGSVQFLYFSKNALRFYNTFEFNGTDELAYFTSFVTEELGLNPQHITLVVSGYVNAGNVYLGRLADFFPSVELNELKVLNLPGHIPPHQILALAALSLCGSSEDV